MLPRSATHKRHRWSSFPKAHRRSVADPGVAGQQQQHACCPDARHILNLTCCSRLPTIESWPSTCRAAKASASCLLTSVPAREHLQAGAPDSLCRFPASPARTGGRGPWLQQCPAQPGCVAQVQLPQVSQAPQAAGLQGSKQVVIGLDRAESTG